jgi:hypothetical protein
MREQDIIEIIGQVVGGLDTSPDDLKKEEYASTKEGEDSSQYREEVNMDTAM